MGALLPAGGQGEAEEMRRKAGGSCGGAGERRTSAFIRVALAGR